MMQPPAWGLSTQVAFYPKSGNGVSAASAASAASDIFDLFTQPRAISVSTWCSSDCWGRRSVMPPDRRRDHVLVRPRISQQANFQGGDHVRFATGGASAFRQDRGDADRGPRGASGRAGAARLSARRGADAFLRAPAVLLQARARGGE